MFAESRMTVYLYQVIDKVSDLKCIQTAAASTKQVFLKIARTNTILLFTKRMKDMKVFNPAKATGHNAFTPPHFILNLSFSLFLILVSCMGELRAQRRLDLSGYTLTWNDEFDYIGSQDAIEAQMFDGPEAKWINGNIYNTTTLIGEQGRPISDAFRENAIVEGGYLNLNSKTEPQYFTVQHNSQSYRINKSHGLITAKYDQDYPCNLGDGIKGFNFGIFEIRAKLPRNYGDMSAFWLWNGYWQCGDDGSMLSCPGSQFDCPGGFCPGWEIDVFETAQFDKFNYFATVQANGLSEPTPCTGCGTYYEWLNSDPSAEFHTYTLAWTPNSMTWFIDGNEIRTQENAVPQLKMNLILSNFTHGDQSQPFVIDYVRVYRPETINYDPNPATQNGSFTWHWVNDPDRLVYADEYARNSYMEDHNYGLRVSNNTPRISPMSSVGGQNSSGGYDIYFTEGNGNLKKLTYPINFVANPPAGPSLTTILNTGLAADASIGISSGTGSVFWKGSDNAIWVRYYDSSINGFNIVRLDNYQYPTDVKGNILVVGQNRHHPDRVYYTSTNQDRLCYYEWCQTQGRWFRHTTPVSGVKEVVDCKDASMPGKLYYRGSDNHIWCIWKFWDAGALCNNAQPTGWQFAPLDYPYTASNADCAGNLNLLRDGTKLYFRTMTNGLSYWDFNTGLRVNTVVNDVKGSINSKRRLDGDIEIFYLSLRDKVKTYYERDAPSIQGERQWQNASLDVFSNVAYWGGQYHSYPGNYYKNFIHLSDIYPTQVFTATQIGDVSGYIEGRNWPSIPPVPYNECSDGGNGWRNGFEGRVAQANPQAAVIQESKEKQTDILSQENKVSVFPNPSKGLFTVFVPEAWQSCELSVMNTLGQNVFQESATIGNQEIDLTGLPAGMYYLNLKKESKSQIIKISIQ